MYTLIIMAVAVSPFTLGGYLQFGKVKSLAGWSLTYNFKSDCDRAGEEIVKEFTSDGVTVKTKCVLVR